MAMILLSYLNRDGIILINGIHSLVLPLLYKKKLRPFFRVDCGIHSLLSFLSIAFNVLESPQATYFL